jgi:protein TonB
MMIQSPSRCLALLKYSLALPFCTFLLLLFAATTVTAQDAPAPLPPSLNQADPDNTKEVLKEVEKMPTFPGCDNRKGKKDYESCSQTAMLTYVYQNIRYPMEARKKGIQGTVVVRFIVEKDGSLTDIVVVRSIGGGCDEEVQRVVASMPKWNPGEHEGEVVRVLFHLPIKFKLD